MAAESWVEFSPGYEVSDFGRVRSLYSPYGLRPKPLILKGDSNKQGYRYVKVNGQIFMVSVLVATTFIGPKPDGMECAHNDGDKLNNHVSNLRWTTRQDNVDDQLRHGTRRRGERMHTAKLTSERVVELRKQFANGDGNYKQLAPDYDLTPQQVSRIVRRKSWAHVN